MRDQAQRQAFAGLKDRFLDRPLSLCMITSFYPPCNIGGDGIYVHGLSNALAERGYRVHAIHCIDTYRAFSKTPAMPTTTIPASQCTRLRAASACFHRC